MLKDKLKLQYFILNVSLIAAEDKINFIQIWLNQEGVLLNCYLVTNHKENGFLPNNNHEIRTKALHM